MLFYDELYNIECKENKKKYFCKIFKITFRIVYNL
jgi:hypothetical protein